MHKTKKLAIVMRKPGAHSKHVRRVTIIIYERKNKSNEYHQNQVPEQ